MRDHKRLLNRVGEIVTPTALTTQGPSNAAVAAIVALGHWHGRHEKRWRATEALLVRVADQSAEAMISESRDQVRSLRSHLVGLEAELHRLRVLSNNGAVGGNTAAHFDDLLARRSAVRAAHDLARLQVVEAEHGRFGAELQSVEEGLDERVEALRSACRLLWSAYRVAYVEALPGAADSQFHGPLIPPAGEFELTQRTPTTPNAKGPQ